MTLKAPRKTGKWLRDDVPHSEWKCLEVRDGGTVCEMCEVTDIGHSHIMVHEKLPGVALDCGCVCAGYMTGNAEQERLRELLYKWRRAFREQKTPIEKLRRKGWGGYHSAAGDHEWTLNWASAGRRSRHSWEPLFVVTVSNRDGWRYAARRGWWPRRDETGHIHSEPFASDTDAALAGIERAELLLADPQWMAADHEAQAAYDAAEKLQNEAEMRDFAIKRMNEAGNTDLVEALKHGNFAVSEAFHELRARIAAAEQRLKAEAAG